MSYTRHHAIVLTSWSVDTIALAHAKAIELECAVTDIVSSQANGYHSFMVGPDGGNEGRELSEEGWRRRCALIEWLRGQYYDGAGSAVAWVEVQYGDDELMTKVTRSSDTDEAGVKDVEEVY